MWDWVSLFLSVFGLSRDRRNRTADQRAEAFRLVAEVGGETGKVLDLIDNETARILTRCAAICPDDPAAADACSTAMQKIRGDAMQLEAMAETMKEQISSVRGTGDWDRVIRDLNEWRATSARLVPWVEGVIARFDAVLDQQDRPA